MKRRKQIISFLLAMVLCLSMGTTVSASESQYISEEHEAEIDYQEVMKEINQKYGVNLVLYNVYEEKGSYKEIVEELENIAKSQKELNDYIEKRLANDKQINESEIALMSTNSIRTVEKIKPAWGYEDYFEVGCKFTTNDSSIIDVEWTQFGPIPGKIAALNKSYENGYCVLDGGRTVAPYMYADVRIRLTDVGRVKLYAEFYYSEY